VNGDIDLKNELLKEALGEVASLALPGLRTAFRFVVVSVRTEGDPLRDALEVALQYRFAIASVEPRVTVPEGTTKRGPIKRFVAWKTTRTENKKRANAQKQAAKAVRLMTQEFGVDVPALIAASADPGTTLIEATQPTPSGGSPAGVLVPCNGYDAA